MGTLSRRGGKLFENEKEKEKEKEEKEKEKEKEEAKKAKVEEKQKEKEAKKAKEAEKERAKKEKEKEKEEKEEEMRKVPSLRLSEGGHREREDDVQSDRSGSARRHTESKLERVRTFLLPSKKDRDSSPRKGEVSLDEKKGRKRGGSEIRPRSESADPRERRTGSLIQTHSPVMERSTSSPRLVRYNSARGSPRMDSPGRKFHSVEGLEEDEASIRSNAGEVTEIEDVQHDFLSLSLSSCNCYYVFSMSLELHNIHLFRNQTRATDSIQK